MDVKAHYDQHLARFYSWMSGNFDSKSKEFQALLAQHEIGSSNNEPALDLGAGHGIQSIALQQAGFKVTAMDFNEHLLAELRTQTGGENVKIVLE